MGLLAVYLQNNQGNGDAHVQLVLYNPSKYGNVTFANPALNFKALVD